MKLKTILYVISIFMITVFIAGIFVVSTNGFKNWNDFNSNVSPDSPDVPSVDTPITPDIPDVPEKPPVPTLNLNYADYSFENTGLFYSSDATTDHISATYTGEETEYRWTLVLNEYKKTLSSGEIANDTSGGFDISLRSKSVTGKDFTESSATGTSDSIVTTDNSIYLYLRNSCKKTRIFDIKMTLTCTIGDLNVSIPIVIHLEGLGD